MNSFRNFSILFVAALIASGLALYLRATRQKPAPNFSTNSTANSVASPGAQPRLTDSSAKSAVQSPQTVIHKKRVNEIIDAFDGSQIEELKQLVMEWASNDPVGCLNFLLTKGAFPARESLAMLAVAVWVDRDETSAKSYVSSKIWQSQENAALLLQPVLRHLYGSGSSFESVANFMASLPQNDQVFGELSPIFAEFLNYNYTNALQYAQGLPALKVRDVFLEFAGATAARRGGLDILNTLTKGESIASTAEITGAISTLMVSFPDQTSAWLLKQPVSSSLDIARLRAAQTLQQRSPIVALELAEQIANPELKGTITERAFEALAARDYQTAEDWAANSNISIEIAASVLVRASSSNVSNTDFASRLNSINEASPVNQQRMQFLLFSQWAARDPQAAAAWLRVSTIDSERKRQFAAAVGIDKP